MVTALAFQFPKHNFCTNPDKKSFIQLVCSWACLIHVFHLVSQDSRLEAMLNELSHDSLSLSGFSPTGTSNDEWHIDTLHCPNCSFSCIQDPFHILPAVHMTQFPSVSLFIPLKHLGKGLQQFGGSQVFCHGDILEAIRRQVDRGPRYQVVDMPSFLAVRLMGEVYIFKEPGNTWAGIRGPIFCNSCRINVCSCNRSNTLPDNPW